MTSFPALRMRRARAAAWSRALVAETTLTPADLIWPLFITEGSGVEEPIAHPARRLALVGRSRGRAGARGGGARHPLPRFLPQHARASCAPTTAARRSTPTI